MLLPGWARVRSQFKERLPANHGLQLPLADEKLSRVEHDVAQLQLTGAAKPMPTSSVDDKNIAGFQRVVLNGSYMDRAATQYHAQFGILVPVRLEIPLMLHG